MNLTQLFPEPAAPVLSATERAHLAALAGFDLMSTSRLVGLQAGRSPVEAFAIASGAEAPSGGIAALFDRHEGLRARWKASALRNQPEQVAEWCEQLGVEIIAPGDDRYPPQLTNDPRRPAVLFAQGDMAVLDSRRIGIVGTRNPTRRGALTAERFGHELAEAGVVVVSGLALGVDGAAHRGALRSSGAPPVAVVANGHDRPYPKRHGSLWADVAERGAVISEWPPGVAPDPYRFPQRNRILAALSELVVVVESRERGGSLITAREAAERGIDVFAVPGPIDQRSSVGTNELLSDGAAPAANVDTLLVALGLDHRRAGRRQVDTRERPDEDGATALAMLRSRSQSIESVAVETGWGLGRAARALAVLERDGWLVEVGGWYESLEAVRGAPGSEP
ncbi:MAG: DNA-processing protein DprA [Ilumatobacter sp.]|uniref:DNA-processing protein DprA n=1 Tax=Ilumatobacter sp. TaxID=1967498 RepID=UPI003C714D90